LEKGIKSQTSSAAPVPIAAGFRMNINMKMAIAIQKISAFHALKDPSYFRR
jgi:hypothetical protein